jgi:hypothetical protein
MEHRRGNGRFKGLHRYLVVAWDCVDLSAIAGGTDIRRARAYITLPGISARLRNSQDRHEW